MRVVRHLLLALALAATAARSARGQADAPVRIDAGRFTAVCYPSEAGLVRTLLAGAAANDTFPGLPRPRQRVLVAVAPDRATFRRWVGPAAPEWGAAIAFPEERRIVLQGRSAGSDAGDPRETLRHELAHLALHEQLGDLAPRWFDEGYASYAAREWRRDDALAANVALALRGTPTLDELDGQLEGAETGVASAYALAYQAVMALAELDPDHGLARLFPHWRETGSLDKALRVGYGITLDGFEQRWRGTIRRRYGALALFGDFTILGFGFLLAMAPLWFLRRRRDRERMAALVASDAVTEARERAERERVIAELLGEGSPPAADDVPPGGPDVRKASEP